MKQSKQDLVKTLRVLNELSWELQERQLEEYPQGIVNEVGERIGPKLAEALELLTDSLDICQDYFTVKHRKTPHSATSLVNRGNR